MKNTKLFASLLLLILIFTVPISAREAVKPARLTFTFITIPGAGISDAIQKEAAAIIRKHLTEDEFFLINDLNNPGDKITFNDCIKEECTGELSKAAPAGIVVLIYITGFEIKTGEKQVSRYVVEDLTETRYTIQAAAVDILNQKYDLLFKETFNSTAKLIDEADRIGLKLKEHYIKRKPAVKEKLKEDIKREVESSAYYNINSISFNLLFMYPFGSFNDITDYGYGAGFVLNGALPSIPSFAISPGLSVYNMAPSGGNISSAYMFLPEITCGYNFIINEKITLTPAVGAGYSLMLIDGTVPDDPGSSGSNFYYNPEFKAGIEALYSLTQDYSLLFDVSYHCIAERDSMLFFSSFNFGIRMNLK